MEDLNTKNLISKSFNIEKFVKINNKYIRISSLDDIGWLVFNLVETVNTGFNMYLYMENDKLGYTSIYGDEFIKFKDPMIDYINKKLYEFLLESCTNIEDIKNKQSIEDREKWLKSLKESRRKKNIK